MKLKIALYLPLVTLLLALAGCATLNPAYQKPEVHLVRFQPLPSQGLEQRFAIGLKVLNPNRMDLKINGISYNLKLQGHKVVSGLSGKVPVIPAYGETQLDLEASTDLFGSLRAVLDLLNAPGKPVSYELETRIDTGWWGLPVTVVESGSIDLGKP